MTTQSTLLEQSVSRIKFSPVAGKISTLEKNQLYAILIMMQEQITSYIKHRLEINQNYKLMIYPILPLDQSLITIYIYF